MNRLAAHASGVFIPREVMTMTTKRTTASAADGGTIVAHADTALGASARAQVELIDLLARLVLASVERDATANEQKPPATYGAKSNNQ